MQRDFRFLNEIVDGEVLEYDRAEVRELLLDLEGTVAQLGGIFTVAAIRQKVGDEYVRVGVAVTYDSFVPTTENGQSRPKAPDIDELLADALAEDDDDEIVAPVGAGEPE